MLERALAEEMTGHWAMKARPGRPGIGQQPQRHHCQDRAHLREMYDVGVSPDLISRVADGVRGNWPNGSPGRWTAFTR